MGSSLSDIRDIIDEYGSFENYKEKSGYNKSIEENKKRNLEQKKKDFENLSFEEYDRLHGQKYYY